MIALFTLGHDVRHRTTFKVKDATAAEAAILEKIESPQALELAASMDAAGRLDVFEEKVDHFPDYWSEACDPVVTWAFGFEES